MSIPFRSRAHEIVVTLLDATNTLKSKTSPTIVAGDFKVSIDGGAYTTLANLPAVGAATDLVVVNLTTAEMDGHTIMVRAQDQVGNEWLDRYFAIATVEA